MGTFVGQTVFIAGASSGIGAALAVEFARHGANLLLAARRLDRLESLAATIGPDRVACVRCDVTRDEDLRRAVATLHARFGPAHVVVANAGFGVAGRFEDLSLDDYQRQFDTNFFGVLRTIRATLDDLKQTRGQLAVIGSVNGYLATPGTSAYCMSKFAVRALCDSLGHELSPHGVGVTHIAPGLVRSEIRQVDNHGVHHPEAPRPAPRRLEMSAEQAARHIVRAVRRRKREAIITAHGQLAVWLARHLPLAVHTALTRRARARHPDA